MQDKKFCFSAVLQCFVVLRVHVDSFVLKLLSLTFFLCLPIALFATSHSLTTFLFIIFFSAQAYECMNDNSMRVSAEVCRHQCCPRTDCWEWQREARVWLTDRPLDYKKSPERLKCKQAGWHLLCAYCCNYSRRQFPSFPYCCHSGFISPFTFNWICIIHNV